MYLIVGLGNPEGEYSNTRHNMGFDTINHLSEMYEIPVKKEKFDALYGEGNIEGQKVILIKPQTYMNESGKSLIQFVNFYKVPSQNIILIQDDMDTDIGKIRVRRQGGPGSHNGMKSIIEYLKTKDFPRIRVGIGRPIFQALMINYVLEKIPEDERKVLNSSTKEAAKAVSDILIKGIDKAMNDFNTNKSGK